MANKKYNDSQGWFQSKLYTAQEVEDGLATLKAVLDCKEEAEAIDLIINYTEELEALESFVTDRLKEIDSGEEEEEVGQA